MSETHCGWFVRKAHRRARRMDVDFMGNALLAASATCGIAKADVAWEAFINQRGQEHWHCACAKQDRKEAIR